MGIQINGIKTILEEVTVDDASDICRLRNNAQINKYLSTSREVTVAEQEAWIKANLTKNDGFYFKVIDKEQNEFCGTASLYGIVGKQVEFGRYICTRALQAIEAEYLGIEYAFKQMGMHKVYCRTAVENKKVWKQHYSYGFVDEGEEKLASGDKDLVLKIQALTREQFEQTDYSFIQKLIQRFQLSRS